MNTIELPGATIRRAQLTTTMRELRIQRVVSRMRRRRKEMSLLGRLGAFIVWFAP